MSERDELIKAARPFADWPIGPEMIDDPDLVLHRNAGRMITVGDVLRLRDTILSPRGEQTEAVAWRIGGLLGPDVFTDSASKAEMERSLGSTVTPLYAHPAEAPSVVLDQGARDLLAELVGDKLAELDDTLGCRAQEGGGGSTEDERSLRKDLHAILAALSPQALGGDLGSSPKAGLAENPAVGESAAPAEAGSDGQAAKVSASTGRPE